jgi:hypothetical protein
MNTKKPPATAKAAGAGGVEGFKIYESDTGPGDKNRQLRGARVASECGALASELLARWIKHETPPVTAVDLRQNQVEDASHTWYYPRRCGQSNYFCCSAKNRRAAANMIPRLCVLGRE